MELASGPCFEKGGLDVVCFFGDFLVLFLFLMCVFFLAVFWWGAAEAFEPFCQNPTLYRSSAE